MNINITKRKNMNTSRDNSSVYDNRIGCWGIVVALHKDTNSVDVKTELGYEIKDVPVASHIWVNSNEDIVTGEINLPTVNSIVFILMPNHSIGSGFVLCSGFLRGDSLSNEFLKKTQEGVIARITQNGWKSEESIETGNKILVSKDEKIKISENVEEGYTEINVYDAIIKIGKNDNDKGIINIEANGNKVELNEKLILKRENTSIELDGTKITMKGTSGKLEIS